MQIDTAAIRAFLSRDLMDLLIRVGLIAFVTILCARIFAPFTGLLLWALILANLYFGSDTRLSVGVAMRAADWLLGGGG